MDTQDFNKKNNPYISLQKASEISGYSSDYIGRLAREKKIRAKQSYSQHSWVVQKDDILPGRDFKLITTFSSQKEETLKKRDSKKYSDNADPRYPAEDFLTLKEASEISGYNADHIGRLARDGKIRAKKIFVNPVWVVHTKDLLNYIKTKKTKPQTKLHYLFVSPYNSELEKDVKFQKIFAKNESSKNSVGRFQNLIPAPVVRVSKKVKVIHSVLTTSKYALVTTFLLGIFLFGGIFQSIAVQFNTKNVEIFPTEYRVDEQDVGTTLKIFLHANLKKRPS